MILLFAYSLGLGAAFVLAGVAFAHAMHAFRWVRSHYRALQVVSGCTLIALGLLLFFNRDWWLRIALDQAVREGRAQHVLSCLDGRVESRPGMATILLVGVDLFLRGKLEALLPEHHFISAEGVDPPDLVIADVGRIDPDEVAETYPDVPLLGFTNHKDTVGLRRAHAAGFDRVIVKSALFERPGELIGGLLAPVE